MHSIVHLIANSTLGYTFYQTGTLSLAEALVFSILGVVIDIDHIFYFLCKTKSLNIKKYFDLGFKMRSKMIPGFYIFHSPEINFLLFIIYLVTQNRYLFFLLLSNLIHLSLDIIEHYRYHKNFDFIKKWSFLIQLKNIV